MFISGRKVKAVLILLIFGVLTLVTLQYCLNLSLTTAKETLTQTKKNFVARWAWPSAANPNITALQEIHLDTCSLMPRNLTRHVDIDIHTLNSTDYQNVNVKPGGRYKPLDCEARRRVAVLVPYRDRENHLKIFLRYMHPFLQRQYINYGIYVLESTPGVKFNRGLLLNIGFVEAKKLYDYDCIIFHDVDLLPENAGIPYTCDDSPLHLSVAIDSKKYKLPYHSYFGGVCGFSTGHFKKINGFSNIYFDWGGEDDDLYERVKYSGLRVIRLSNNLGRYKMLQHGHANENPDKMRLFKSMRARQQTDGLNSLKYRVVKQELKRLYTWILVSINETDVMESEPVHKAAFRQKM